MTKFEIHSIGIIHNAYDEKFGVPRQSGLSNKVISKIELLSPYNNEDYIRELHGFSHLWVNFVFHQHINKESKPLVRPPRLGGNKKVGVFASRSPFRPNSLGMSVVKLEKISIDNNSIYLYVSGADIMNGTPIVDIKPYIKYADSIPGAISSYASEKPKIVLEVVFSHLSNKFLMKHEVQYSGIKEVIIETLELDPRPSYVHESDKIFGLSLYGLNIRWRVVDGVAEVLDIND